MNDAYDIDGVTVTPLGGGVYELKHSSLPEPGVEKERGKEKAEERAREIAKAAKAAEDGHIEQQGPLDASVIAAPAQGQPAQEKPEVSQRTQSDSDAEIAKLKAALAEQTERADKLEEASAHVADALEETRPPRPSPPITGAVPRRFEGEMDSETKRLLKSMGQGVKRIILEENENIPPTGLFLGHNGRGYMIQPGGEVDVPEFLLNVLNDAVMATPLMDTKTQKVLGWRNRLRYPYREVKG